ncbi:MAG TPA: tRNA pseudouridine(55) synthase TruB [Actinomycetota bacterium]|nr:tRNA pseudouridine(55) synthase TruB [Actinomycetota bacterium]
MTHGLLLVDKPSGVTSHDVVERVRRAIGVRKVGHAGTLDPMATGLLVLGVGRATRLLRFLGDLEKEYEGTARLGEVTDTLDADGQIVRTSPVDVEEAAVRDAMAAFHGDILQRPPAYSAVKVGGRRMYAAARKGEELEAELRSVRVDAFELVSFDGRHAGFRIVCSSGTYVRSLVADVGEKLGCGAHLARLVRTRIGLFHVRDARPPEDPGDPLPLERAVAHLPRRDAEHDDEARAASNGRCLGPSGLDGPHALFDPDGRLVGIFRDTGTKSCPEVVLPAG